MALPVKTVVMPSTLSGQSNGKLPSNLLALIGVGSAQMEVTAARAFRAMFAWARLAGFWIKEVGDYRTYIEQLNLFLSRYKPVSYAVYNSTPSAHRKYWAVATSLGYVSVYWIKKDFTLATAAVPGSSNHGWGLALDIAQETDGDPGPEGITTAFVNWLIAHADTFGICAELQSEPWHWRYYRGDAIPKAVLDYEAGIPVPDPDPDPDPTPPPAGGITVTFDTIVLQSGSTGSEVKRLQTILNEVSGAGLTTDGQFGAKTKTAVTNWQRFFKVPITMGEGVVDAETWESVVEIWLVTAK